MISIARAIARIVDRIVRFARAVEADDQPHARAARSLPAP